MLFVTEHGDENTSLCSPIEQISRTIEIIKKITAKNFIYFS